MPNMDFSTNPFDDEEKIKLCDAIIARGKDIVDNRAHIIEDLLDDYGFTMALAKLLATGMNVPLGGDLMAITALIMGAMEIRGENDKTDETARRLLDYDVSTDEGELN